MTLAFCVPSDNLALAATRTATSTRSSSVITQQETTRTGRGSIALAGPYTGAGDAVIDIEIVAGAATAAVTTTPVLTGAGNGAMTGVSALAGTAAQTITATLRDLGTRTTYATLDLGVQKLRAKASGTGGNSIRLQVDPSGIIRTAANVALLGDWAAGTEKQVGDQWDFGGLPLMADGSLDPGAPVIAIGTDPQVFRAYKIFEGGQWAHYLTPTPQRALPRGTNVYNVTGSASVTVTDGVTPEVYSSITTVYSLMLALAASALVEPVNAVINDTTPAGQASVWLALRTTPYVLPPINSGSRYVYGLEPEVGSSPYTEEIAVECIDNERIGAERWSVTGTVSGALDDAVTDVAYSSDRVAFTIPLRPYEGAGGALSGTITAKYNPKTSTNDNRVCALRPVVGALATDQSVTFVWTARPVDTCPCETGTFTGEPSEECLGLPIPSDPTGGFSVDPEILSRRSALWAWSAEIIGDNTTLSLNSTLATAVLKAIKDDIDFIKDTRDIFDTAINICGTSAASRAVWDTAYTNMLAEIEPLRYIAGAAPAAVATGYQWVADAELVPTLVPSWTGDLTGIYVLPTVRNGCAYRFVTSPLNTFTTGSTEPTWPTTAVGEQVTDGDIIWELAEIYWQPSTVYPALHEINVYDGIARTTTLGGTSGATYPVFSTYTATADGTITWDLTGGPSGYDLVAYAAVNRQYVVQQQGPSYYVVYMVEAGQSIYRGAFNDETKANAAITRYKAEDATSTRPADPRESFLDKYRELMGAAKIAGGFDPKNEASTSNALPGGTCWQDNGDDHFWADKSGKYLPMFNGVYYTSAIRKTALDGTVTVESTREFGLAPVAGCPEKLEEGDELVITIEGAGTNKTYQIGDKYLIPIVNAGDAYLTGGVVGNDTLTWSVAGTVAGALADYTAPIGSEPVYSDGGIDFKIEQGGIPFALADKWTFDVLGGRFRWRKDAGSWSADTDIPTTAFSLTDGLTATFTPNRAPSFSVGDVFTWDITQVYSSERVLLPDDAGWEWSGATATLTLDLGTAQDISAAGIVHDLPAGATVTLEGSSDNFATTDWSEAVTITSNVIYHALATLQSSRYVRVVLTSATSGTIRYLWLGVPYHPSKPAPDLRIRRAYTRLGGAGLRPSRTLAAAGWDASMTLKHLDADELDTVTSMADELAEPDAALIFATPRLAWLYRLGPDSLDVTDFWSHQAECAGADVAIEFEGVQF